MDASELIYFYPMVSMSDIHLPDVPEGNGGVVWAGGERSLIQKPELQQGEGISFEHSYPQLEDLDW